MARQRASQFLSRHRLTLETSTSEITELVLAGFLENRPATLSATREQVHGLLTQLRATFLSGNRVAVVPGACALFVVHAEASDLFSGRFRNYCAELLADVGSPEAPLRENFLQLDQALWAISRNWARRRDYLALAVSLLRHANLYRTYDVIRGDESHQAEAIGLVRGAIDVLRSRCRGEDRTVVAFVEHQATLWAVRLVSIHAAEPENAKAELQRLKVLAEECSESMAVQVETSREETHWQLKSMNYLEAEKLLECTKALATALPFSSANTMLSILKIEVELLLETGRRRQAHDAIDRYFDLWQRHPDLYHYRWLEALFERHEIKAELPKSETFGRLTPAIPHLYLERRLLRL